MDAVVAVVKPPIIMETATKPRVSKLKLQKRAPTSIKDADTTVNIESKVATINIGKKGATKVSTIDIGKKDATASDNNNKKMKKNPLPLSTLKAKLIPSTLVKKMPQKLLPSVLVKKMPPPLSTIRKKIKRTHFCHQH
jgi:hypothetical protein